MSHDEQPAKGIDAFPTTGWSLIRAVQEHQQVENQPALERFARLYWRPVFCFLRARGCPQAEAEDLAQEFLVWLFYGQGIQRADPQRGRFRPFLRLQLRSFLADHLSPRRLTRQKQFERQLRSLEGLVGGGQGAFEPAAGETPDQAFDRAFARSVIHTVRAGLRTICETERRQEWYAIFEAAYPEDPGTQPVTQQALAERHGKTRDEVRGVLDRMKKRCERLLRTELRDHAADEEDIEAEVGELLRLLALNAPRLDAYHAT